MCAAEEDDSCPRHRPNQLTPAEVLTIKRILTDPLYRHIPTGRLALLAQRLGKVVAAPSTWYELVRRHRWRRPRRRIHPARSTTGLRTSRPDEAWHVDTTIIRLLDGTKLYLHGVIDSFSKRILSWHLAPRLEAASTASILLDAIRRSVTDGTPTAIVDGGCENFNSAVDELVHSGQLRRLLAQTDLRFSNSPIESFWRSLKHQWLYLNTLDSQPAVEKLVAFFVEAHNSLPHSAFDGQTPDEMYHDRGSHIPNELAAARERARQARLETNRALTCAECPHSRTTSTAA